MTSINTLSIRAVTKLIKQWERQRIEKIYFYVGDTFLASLLFFSIQKFLRNS